MPELRPNCARIGSARDRLAGLPGVAGRIGCQRADGAFGGAERLVIDGGSCVPAMRQRGCPWGEVRFRCSSKARGVCLGQRGLGRGRSGAARFSSSPSRPVRFRLAHPVGGVWQCRGLRGGSIGLVVDQIVIPGAAERRPGIRAPLKEAGFPPSRE